jgi:hypothetical protein
LSISNGDLNFVFGEAYKGRRIAAIYLPRLRQEFYGLESNELVFHERIVKEAIHELGHTLVYFIVITNYVSCILAIHCMILISKKKDFVWISRII